MYVAGGNELNMRECQGHPAKKVIAYFYVQKTWASTYTTYIAAVTYNTQ